MRKLTHKKFCRKSRMKISLNRPNSVCYSRAAATEKYNLKKYDHESSRSSAALVSRPLPRLDESDEFHIGSPLERKSKLSASLRSLKQSARRKSIEAFRQIFKIKRNKQQFSGSKFKRRVSNISVEFWEEDYLTIKRK